MKINKIICLGDSITGTCCTGYDFYDGLKFYPFLLGEHFNCEIKNYGQGNNSNEKIGIDILDVLQKENTDDSVIIKTLQNIIISEEPIKVILNDNSSIKISLSEAKSLVKAHDNLNINNQRIMRNSLMESKESFDKIMNFSKNNKIEESPNVY